MGNNWKISKDKSRQYIYIEEDEQGKGLERFVAAVRINNYVAKNTEQHYDEAKDKAKLIAEAGTVHNETGCTPRELLEQRDKLLEACEELKGISQEFLAVIKENCSRCTHKCCNACRWGTYQDDTNTAGFQAKAAIEATT